MIASTLQNASDLSCWSHFCKEVRLLLSSLNGRRKWSVDQNVMHAACAFLALHAATSIDVSLPERQDHRALIATLKLVCFAGIK